MAEGEALSDRLRELRNSLEALPEVTEPPKSTLRVLGSTRAERKWNTLLAYFLDPSQPHGFDADLLTTFLDTITQTTEADLEYYHRDIETVQVETEISSPQNNRLDIVIRSPGAWFVCIESKVEAPEEEGKLCGYLKDPYIGSEEKDEYPEDGHHYVFLSKEHRLDASIDEFADLYWEDIVETFQAELRRSHGQYPNRSTSQLQDFLSTVIRVTNMEDDDFTETQQEKVRLLSEYRDDIEELFEAADALREQAIERWPELFLDQLDGNLWTDEWHYRYDDYGEYGCFFRNGWYLDDENLETTVNHDETTGSTGFRLHLIHMIRRKESFRDGKLTLILRSPTKVELRDEFNSLYNSDRWQDQLEHLLNERGITNKGNMRDYTEKTYEVDQSRLPESYFETLATAFEEHIPVAKTVDGIVEEALDNVENR